MKKTFVKSCFLFALFSSNLSFAQQQAKIEWPVITQQAKPWTRWWWQGSAVNNTDLKWMLEEYKKVGLGGVEITPIYGVKGYEKDFIDFMSKKWIEKLGYTLTEAQNLGLGVDIAQASGWPFGGPWMENDDASKYLSFKKYNLKSGEKLQEKIVFQQKEINRAVSVKPNLSAFNEDISKNIDLQTYAIDQIRFAKELYPILLMAYSDNGEIIDLTNKVDEGILKWIAPKGNWQLYALFESLHGKMVERAGPGGEGYAIDHFSKKATDNYLKYFNQLFKGNDVSYLRGFFNDSYEVDDAQGEANWTPLFLEEFKKRRGYNLAEYLPALFDKENKNHTQILIDYRETISDLLLDNYTKTWHNWAKSYGKIIRNQAHGSPANILDLYAATDIPEAEGQDILRVKFASSAANVMGKKLSSSEIATWNNEHFLTKLSDVKNDVDIMLLSGINHQFYHGANYTPKAESWPGWLFYAAVHFTPNNPFWKDFTQLNTYLARSQSFMQLGNADNDVLLYLPIYDAYANDGRSMLQHFDGINHGFKGSVLEKVAQQFLNKGYAFDYISDKQLLNTTINNNLIETGGIKYKTVVVPSANYMPLTTFKRLLSMAKEGANVVFINSFPNFITGFNDIELNTKSFENLKSEIKFLSHNNYKKTSIGKGNIVLLNDSDIDLKSVDVDRETLTDVNLKMIRRKDNDAYIYFIKNDENKAFSSWVTLSVNVNHVVLFNPMTGKTGIATTKKNDGKTAVYLELQKEESIILKTSNETVLAEKYTYLQPLKNYPIHGKWNVSFTDGGPVLPKSIEIENLKNWTTFDIPEVENFSGTASYKIGFKKPKSKSKKWILDLGNVEESAEIILNNKPLVTLLGPVYQIEIPNNLLQKNNQLEIKVTNSMANRIIYMDKNNMPWKKFYNINMPARLKENLGTNGLFTAQKWTAKPSGLLGPVVLKSAQELSL